MRQDLSANPTTVAKRAGGSAPLSSMCHEVGLATVAAELRLHIDELELDAAEAVERGGAVLFLAGLGLRPTKSPRRDQTSEEGGGRKVRRAWTKAIRSAHPRNGKVRIIANRSPIPERSREPTAPR